MRGVVYKVGGAMDILFGKTEFATGPVKYENNVNVEAC